MRSIYNKVKNLFLPPLCCVTYNGGKTYQHSFVCFEKLALTLLFAIRTRVICFRQDVGTAVSPPSGERFDWELCDVRVYCPVIELTFSATLWVRKLIDLLKPSLKPNIRVVRNFIEYNLYAQTTRLFNINLTCIEVRMRV